MTLTRSFFESDMEALGAAFAREQDAQSAHPEVMLRDGVTLRIEALHSCTESYVAFDYKSGNHLRRIVVPYKAIMGVSFTTDQTGVVGFHR